MNERIYDGMTPLPESDLTSGMDTAEEAAETFIEGGVMNDEAPTDDAPTTENPVVTAQPILRRRWSFGADFMSAVVAEPHGEVVSVATFDMTTLPPLAYAHVAAFGVSVLCGRADDPAREFARRVSGAAAAAKPKAPPKVNYWRQAIALALVDATKKSESPLTLDAATISATGMTVAHVKEAKNDPKVVTHYRKLAGITSSVAGLLASA